MGLTESFGVELHPIIAGVSHDGKPKVE